nr:chitobiase/beta-hexosaminidase C-terminal domain-containing protein [uncultured Methanobrevibacter sp.]
MLINPTTDFNNTVEVDDNSQLSSQEDSPNCLLDKGSDYVVNSPIVNPDFEDGLSGWDGYGVSITNFALNSKSGTKFISLSTNGYISQVINFDTIDSVSFWYMSNTKNATINIHVDDISLDNYTIQKTGLGKKKWEEVKLDLSNFTGYHTINITQSYGLGYIDYFNITYNNNIIANFTIGSYEISDGKIRINFTDLSQGLISEYLWDFGDENYSDNQNPTHTFKANSYIITLTVFNNDMESSYSFSLPVSVCKIQNKNIEFPSIQDAIDVAADGDIISIFSNYFTDNHFENLIIDKSVTLNFINASINPKNISKPTIKVINESQVIINNLLLGDCESISKTSDDSSLTIQKSNITNKNMILDEGNIFFENNIFVNSSLTVLQSNTSILKCNISNGGIIVNGGKSIINNNNFSSCDVAIKQNQGITNILNCNFSSCDVAYSQDGGNSKISNCNFSSCNVAIQQGNGELNVTRNLIEGNDIGIKSFGNADIHFNNIYRNNNFSLIADENVDYSNNWWGTNNPSYYSSLIIPNEYYDVYFVNESSSKMNPWLILNVTQHDLDVDKWIGGVTYYNLTIDLTHNNLGEDTSSLGHLGDRNCTFTFNDVDFDIFLEDGFKQLLFTWGYLTGDVSQMNIKLDNENYQLFIDTDNVAPIITYITPTTTFNDEMEVIIECDDSEAVIFYTLDGSNPCYSNTRLIYTQPFTIDNSITVHYTAIDKMGNRPMFCYGEHLFTDLVIERVYSGVFVECSSSGTVYYTVDGSIPYDRNNPNRIIYSHMFYVNEPTKFLFSSIFKYEIDGYPVPTIISIRTYTDFFSINYIKSNLSNLSENAIWSQYQGSNNNSGITDYCGPVTNLTKWNLDLISSGSAVIDKKGHIYIGGDDGYLYCLNNQGLVIWRYGTTSKIISTPTIGADGNIYFSNWMNSTVYCISPNGQLLWKCILGDYNTGSSIKIADDGSVYAITSSDISSSIYSLKNGSVVWNCSIPLISGSTPAIGLDGTIYLISESHEFVAVSPDGTLKFKQNLIKYYSTEDYLKESKVSVSIDEEGIIYVINQPNYRSNQGDIVNIFIRAYYPNGTVKWSSKNTQLFVSGTPTYYKGILYLSSEDKLVAVNASNGAILWSKKINSAFYSASSPLISGNEMIYLAHDNMVYAFDLTGQQLWNYTLTGKYGDPSCLSSPTLSNDGTLIVTTNQGIFAFNDVAAQFKWEHVNNTETTVQFTDLSVKGNNSYFWDFGDGNYSLEQNPVHVYNDSGKYRVVLIVEHDGVNLARNTTIEVVKYDLTPPSNVTVYIGDVVSEGGVFATSQNVSLYASDDAGSVTIYYTVDGSNPVNSSTRRLYYEPILIESNTVLKTVAVDESDNFGEVTSISFEIRDALNVNDLVNSTLIQKIQDLLDNAEEGSKFVFDYDVLYGANFTINKPLNIVTTNNTKLIGNGNQPVFTLGENASGTTINGFVIENDGILIKNSDDILIKNTVVNTANKTGVNIVSSSNIAIKDSYINGSCDGILINKSTNTTIDHSEVAESYNNGVWVLESSNTNIYNSKLDNNGKEWQISKAHQIWLVRSQNTNIINNTINYGFFGVHLSDVNQNLKMDYNTIYEGTGDAIILEGGYYGVNITHNTLDGCFNGINFNGYSERVNVEHNLIQKMHYHQGEPDDIYGGIGIMETYDFWNWPDTYGQYHNAIQVSCGASNFHDEVTIIDNVCILLEHRSWEARHTNTYIDSSCSGYGYNLMDGSSSLTGRGGATSYREGKVDLVVDRVGDSSFRLRLINRLDGHYLSEIPEFDVTFIAGGFSQTVKFKDSEAVATFDTSSAITTVVAKISTEIQKSVAFDIPITDGYSSSNKDKDSGYEAGEAINNPDPVIPSIADAIKELERRNSSGSGNGNGGGNGNGQGTGTGNGQGSGNGHGSSGHGGSNVNGREGEIEGDANNLLQTDSGNSPSVGVEAAAQGDSDSVEGGSQSGELSQDSPNAYEVSKVININENNWQFVQAVILFAVIVIFGYGYRRGKKDGDEI